MADLKCLKSTQLEPAVEKSSGTKEMNKLML